MVDNLSETYAAYTRAMSRAGVTLDFMPDNISWSSDGNVLAAGIKGVAGECPPGSGEPCIQGFGVAAIDTHTMAADIVYDSAGKGALISGVSVAVEAAGPIYVGAGGQ